MKPRARTSLCFCLFALSGGCAATARESAQAAAPAAVEAAVDEAREPENRKRIAQVLDDPEVQEAVRNLSEAAGGGVLDSLESAEREARLAALTERLVAGVGRALAASMKNDLGPAVAALSAEAVNQSLDSALSPQRMEQVGASVTTGVLRGFSEFAAQNQGMTQTVGLVARSVGREAALGFQDAVHATDQRREGNRESGDVLAAAGRAADLTLGVTPFLLLSAGLLTLLIAAALLWAILRLREQRRELGELKRNRLQTQPILHDRAAGTANHAQRSEDGVAAF